MRELRCAYRCAKDESVDRTA